MPIIKTLPCGPYQTNAYLIMSGDSDAGNEAILIDAPPESYQTVQGVLAASGQRLTAVLITHPHFDHTLDASSFANADIPIYAHPDAVEGIEHPQTLGLIATPGEGFPGAAVSEEISGGEVLHLAGLDIQVLEVPGHSPGSLAFYIPALESCFPGDVIFQGSVGRTDLPGGNFDVLSDSIRTALYSLEDPTDLYPGHGPSTTVADEKKNNPFVSG